MITIKALRKLAAVALLVCAAMINSSLAKDTDGQTRSLAARIGELTSGPQYKHASFGVEVYSLDTEKVVYALHGQELFTPASTTKLLTEGTALELLGADYRFHTRVYATGPVSADGVLKGDLVLVASGDPNLSGRAQPDGTLAFENEDHVYGGVPEAKAVPGDPLAAIHELVAQVAAHGVKRIDGRVLVDASLFPEIKPQSLWFAISPVSVNDNIVDVTVSPGAAVDAPATVDVSPRSSYVSFVNHTKTGAAGSKVTIDFDDDTNPDGSHTVTLTGAFPLQGPSILYDYDVPGPTRFCQVVLTEALREKGIAADLSPADAKTDFAKLVPSYTPERVLAEHVSPPLSEEVKVTLKVSQNIHAAMTPYVVGAVLGKKTSSTGLSGFDLEHAFLAKAGLDMSGASQADGAGGSPADYFTPDFMVHYLAFMSKQKDFAIFKKALPILGHDGTLWNIEVNSPGSGRVFAKTGTIGEDDPLNGDTMLYGKGLAGYTTTKDGRHLAFAAYANRVAISKDDPNATRNVGELLGQIATAIYLSSGN